MGRAGSAGGASTGGGGAARRLAYHAGLFVTLAFIAGGLVGAGMHAVLAKGPPSRVADTPLPASAAATIASQAIPPSIVVTPNAPDPVPIARAPRLSATHAVAPPADSSSLKAERAVLDGARAALTRDDSSGALLLTDEHARRFARPQLGEEREAIAIQALVLAGRYDDARSRAARFRATSPNSLFLPVVDASLASIP